MGVMNNVLLTLKGLAPVTHLIAASPATFQYTLFTKTPFVLIKLLRDSLATQFDMLLDVFVVDTPTDTERYQLVYMLASSSFGNRCLVKTAVSEHSASVKSVVSLFSSAGWLEREVWDMHGVYFVGNGDLRRILLDYGFAGHPLSKDFPLSGYLQVRYDDEQKQVVTEPVSFTQEFRYFQFLSPWHQKINNEQ